MTETKVKKRGWVKNAAIIFLAVMLVLTFFSNTIMNISLPEVATKSVGSGTITAKVRGSGVVEANDIYELSLKQTREIEAVAVKLNQEVTEGDLLFTLAGNESDELKAAQQELENLETTYRRALLNQAEKDYAKDDRAIELKKLEIEEAEQKREEYEFSDARIDYLETEITNFEYRNEVADIEIESLQKQLLELDETSGYSQQMKTILTQIEEKRAQLAELQKSRPSENLAYQNALSELRLYTSTDPAGLMYIAVEKEVLALKAEYDGVSKKYSEWIDFLIYYEGLEPLPTEPPDEEPNEEEPNGEEPTDEEPTDEEPGGEESNNEDTTDEEGGLLFAVSLDYGDGTWPEEPTITLEELETTIHELTLERVKTSRWQNQLSTYVDAQVKQLRGSSNAVFQEWVTAYDELGNTDSEISKLNSEISKLQADYNELAGTDTTDTRKAINSRISNLQTNKSTYDKRLAELNKELTEHTTAKEKKEAADAEIKALELALENMLFDLVQQKKDDDRSQVLAEFDLDIQRRDIYKKQEEIEELKAEELSSEFFSPVSGKVTALNIKPGVKPGYDEVILTIEMVERGYFLECTITAEQAKRVSLGEQASITGSYWGPQITLTLINIRNDPDSPRDKRRLTFKAEGEVETGTQVNFELGNKGVKYDLIVPNSAVKTDSNGDFVLLFTTKSMPALGDRYVAQRVDVNVLDSDDTNSAISGGVTNWDFVITSSDKPIESGDYVRMSK